MPKPSGNLEALTVPKGEAVRPHQHLKAEPAESRRPGAPSPRGAITSLTLRLNEESYEKLRAFAFKHRRTHQDILAGALADYLDRDGA